MKSFEEILSDAGVQISDFENHRLEELKVLKKQNIKGLTVGFLIFALSIIFSIMHYNGWIMIIGFVIALVFFFIIRGGTLTKLRKDFKEQVIKSMIEIIDPSFEYHPGENISKEVFKQSQFIKYWSYYRGEDLFRGIYNETEVEFSELHITQRSDKTQITVFKGPFYLIRNENVFSGRTTVVRDYAEKLLGNFGRSLQKLNFSRDKLLQIDNPEFEKHFAVYSNDEEEAKAILNPDMINFLLREQKKAKQVFFGFSEGNIYFGIFNSRDLYKIKIKEEINDNVLRKFYDELKQNLELAEELHTLVRNAQQYNSNIQNKFVTHT